MDMLLHFIFLNDITIFMHHALAFFVGVASYSKVTEAHIIWNIISDGSDTTEML
jgi:hypothetical protein